MGHNSRELKASPDPKAPAKPKDVIVDPMGQWKHPGKVTKIPSNKITMKGVPYPVLGVDDLGNYQVMHPGMDYVFPGNSVTEFPQNPKWLDDLEEKRKGGRVKGLSKFTSKNIKTSVNKLMLRNETLFGEPGKKIYDPNAKGWLDKYK